MNYKLSPMIFQEFMNGRMINKIVLNDINGEPTKNTLFEEITGHIETYIEVYKCCGFDLVRNGESFFIRERGLKQYDENAMNAMVLLDCIYRGALSIGTNPSILRELSLGLPVDQLDKIQAIPDINLVLKSCGFQKNLLVDVKASLVNRKLAYITNTNSLVLSDAGIAFIDELHDDAYGGVISST